MHLEEHDEEWITLTKALELNPTLTRGMIRQRIRRGKLESRQGTEAQALTVTLVRRSQIVEQQAPGAACQQSPGNELESSR